MTKSHDLMAGIEIPEWIDDYDRIEKATSDQRKVTEQINIAIWKDGRDYGYAQGKIAGYKAGRAGNWTFPIAIAIVVFVVARAIGMDALTAIVANL